MKSLGYMKGTRKKERKSQNVSNNIKQQISQVHSRPPFSGIPRCVEVVTPASLFTNKSYLKTVYRVV